MPAPAISVPDGGILPGVCAVDWHLRPVLGPAATARLDQAAAAAGIAGTVLMEHAGRAVARFIIATRPPQPVLVLCGPGKNGGDGWVVARRLQQAGWPVRVASLVPRKDLLGDAAHAAWQWQGPVETLSPELAMNERLVVDALFGVGLDRSVDGPAAAIVERLNATGIEVVAVDMPSGVDGATGAVMGPAVRAAATVSFVTAKHGHLLLPGALHTGCLHVADIGIGEDLLAAEDQSVRVNGPAIWQHLLRKRRPGAHKYDHGHVAVVGGPAHASGAARLAAGAAAHAGAGLVTILAEVEALPTYAAHLTAIMLEPLRAAADLAAQLGQRRIDAAVIGPAAGLTPRTLELAMALIAWGRPLVLDADALTLLAPGLGAGTVRLHGRCVLTPHDGEFKRLIDLEGDRLSRARGAAAALGAVMLLKGADTVVAAPDGRATILTAAPPGLATAGSGDVLAGIVAAMLGQGLPPFEAASAAVWLHAAAGSRAGLVPTAEALAPRLGSALASLERSR